MNKVVHPENLAESDEGWLIALEEAELLDEEGAALIDFGEGEFLDEQGLIDLDEAELLLGRKLDRTRP